MAAAISIARSLGLTADDAIVLQDSNRLALRLLPCDALARVAHAEHQVAQFEVDLAQQLAEDGSPVGALDPRIEPRVYEQDGYVVTLWTYYDPTTPQEISPSDYASALERLHASLRKVDIPAPHFTDRVEHAQQLVASRDRTPDLADADRELLASTLRNLRRAIGDRDAPEQLLHGEPHPGNLLATKIGPLFIDLETCCRGPVEFDLAHAPEEVSAHYPDVNQALLRECRILMLAMITTWRWDRDDQLPNGRQLATEWLTQIPGITDLSQGCHVRSLGSRRGDLPSPRRKPLSPKRHARREITEMLLKRSTPGGKNPSKRLIAILAGVFALLLVGSVTMASSARAATVVGLEHVCQQVGAADKDGNTAVICTDLKENDFGDGTYSAFVETEAFCQDKTDVVVQCANITVWNETAYANSSGTHTDDSLGLFICGHQDGNCFDGRQFIIGFAVPEAGPVSCLANAWGVTVASSGGTNTAIQLPGTDTVRTLTANYASPHTSVGNC